VNYKLHFSKPFFAFMGILALSASLSGCGGDTATTATATVNVAPTANPGPSQNVLVGSVVNMDGSASKDSDGGTLTFKWTLIGKPIGSAATLTNPGYPNPKFTADLAGNYVLSLVVNDGKIDSAITSVSVTASTANAAPVANAGNNQNVTIGSTVTLDGTTSSDANNDSLTYKWTLQSKPSNSSAVISPITSAKPTFKADLAGTYVATLVVSDGKANSDLAVVSILASVANSAPVAKAGVNQNVVVGTSITLDGTASSDANGDTLTYRWSLLYKPSTSLATLSSTSFSKPTFTADAVGTYVASLIVNDGKADSAAVASTTVIAEALNVAPVANAGPAQTVLIGSTVSLTGAASSDANADKLTYKWVLTTKPTGSTASLSSSSAVSPTFKADVEGVFVASLIVNDGKVDSATSTVPISSVLMISGLTGISGF
jgi:transcription elongation GreA/GreB family factor